MLLDPFGQCAVQRCRHDNPWVDGRQFGFVECDAQPQASRATTVLHALLEIEDFHFADQAAGAGQTLQVLPDTLVATAFFRHDQQHGAVRTRQQLAVEQVGTNRVFHADGGTWHTHRLKFPTDFGEFALQFSEHLLGLEERVLVIEQHFAVADRNHVVVEHALIDHRRVLLGVDHAVIAQAVQTGNGLGRFEGLARRVLLRCRVAGVERAATEHEELDTGFAVLTAETRVVGRAFVTELRHGRQGSVVGEVFLVSEHRPQHAAGGRVFDAAVIFAVEVGSGEMHTAVSGVSARADGGGVGHPHARGRATGHQQRHRVFGSALDHLSVGAAKAQATQCSHIRALLRCQYALLETHFHQRFHLCQALQRRFLGVGRLLAVALGRDVAVGQAAVVMGRPH
ncbi:hypothetical protein D3C71_1270070 [compost metagenome]